SSASCCLPFDISCWPDLIGILRHSWSTSLRCGSLSLRYDSDPRREPAHFSEPAFYLIRPDGTLYFGSVQTMPFARPHFSDILAAIDYVLKNNYPARGEVREL